MRGYDDYNTKEFREHYDEGTYVCCNCGRLVPLENTYSDGGRHLVCRYCVSKLAKLLNTSIDNIIKMIHSIKE